MSVIQDIVNDERKRLERLFKVYEKKISALPRGSISVKKRGNGLYCYLVFRDGKKIIYQYLGKERSSEVKKIESKISERKHYERLLEKVKENLEQAR